MPRDDSRTPVSPRRGRHRTTTPVRLVAALAALLVTGGIVVAAGQAAAQSDSGSGSSGSGLLSALSGSDSDSGGSDSDSGSGSDQGSDSGGSDSGGSDSGGSDNGGSDNGGSDGDGDSGQDAGSDQNGQENQDGQDDQDDQDSRQTDDPGDRGDNADNRNSDGDSSGNQGRQGDDNARQAAADPFPGRDEAGPAGADSYVDIRSVDANGNRGEGGEFTNAGVYTVDCGVSDHNNSDNYMAAPGKRNGAQHVHDYVGNETTNANSDDDALESGGTSCGNGDRSTFFWPVLRNLNGTGSDVGADGGGLDGNVGSILTPVSAQLSFHGHGDQQVEALPQHLMMITGNAKAGTANGENANAKYTCSGFTDRVTDRYPICPSGSRLIRILDYPSCWDGQNLESEDLRSHMAFPDEQGNCTDGKTPVPALRITLSYNQPAGRSFAIDSFPNQQHNPDTDHSDFEHFSSTASAEAGADCINQRRTCRNLPQ